jgi:hypothetical protein
MADEGEHHEGKRPKQLSRNLAQAPAVWKTERGSCHMAYPPGLLPASAWKKQMDDLKNHYGVNATLTAEDEKIIRSYLSTAAASNGPTTATARVSHRASPPPAGLCASMMKSAPACGSAKPLAAPPIARPATAVPPKAISTKTQYGFRADSPSRQPFFNHR